MRKEKPDIVVWSEENGYDAGIKSYPTNSSAPPFKLPDVGLVKNQSTKKMMDTFEREKEEIRIRIESLYQEFNDSMRVWESKISFEPIIGKTYFLYNFDGKDVLSLLSPYEWNKKESFIGAFTLNSDNKWIRNKSYE